MSPSVEIGATRSGGRLGGISTMVTQANICPSCGGQHETRRRAFWERPNRIEQGCPVVVHGPFPVLMKLPEPAEVVIDFPFDTVASRERGALSSQGGELPPGPRRVSQLPIPWPSPSFDEAYL
ncbi:MAG: hypothetical protein L3K14_10135 [Thermoplasmata archaeon]|nr:hypothetical protein [Thermoplasmata archaeon]